MTAANVLAARNIPRWLEVIAQLLAVTAILLPVLGALMRYVSFSVTPGIAAPFELAPASSLSHLVGVALLGFGPSVAPAVWYVLVFSVGIAAWRPFKRAWRLPAVPRVEDASASSNPDALTPYRELIGSIAPEPEPPGVEASAKDIKSTKAGHWIAWVQEMRQAWDDFWAGPTSPTEPEEAKKPIPKRDLVWGLIALIIVAVLGIWTIVSFLGSPIDRDPAGLLWFLVFATVTVVTVALELPTRSLMLFAGLWLVVFATLSGFIYRGEVASRYAFDSAATPASDGWYARVAERDGFLYLLPCPRGGGPVVAVSPAAIRGIQMPTATRPRTPVPSIWDLVTGTAGNKLGLDPSCP